MSQLIESVEKCNSGSKDMEDFPTIAAPGQDATRAISGEGDRLAYTPLNSQEDRLQDTFAVEVFRDVYDSTEGDEKKTQEALYDCSSRELSDPHLDLANDSDTCYREGEDYAATLSEEPGTTTENTDVRGDGHSKLNDIRNATHAQCIDSEYKQERRESISGTGKGERDTANSKQSQNTCDSGTNNDTENTAVSVSAKQTEIKNQAIDAELIDQENKTVGPERAHRHPLREDHREATDAATRKALGDITFTGGPPTYSTVTQHEDDEIVSDSPSVGDRKGENKEDDLGPSENVSSDKTGAHFAIINPDTYRMLFDNKAMNDDEDEDEEERRCLLSDSDHSFIYTLDQSCKTKEGTVLTVGGLSAVDQDGESSPICKTKETPIHALFLGSTDESAPLLQSDSSFGVVQKTSTKENVSIVSSSQVKYQAKESGISVTESDSIEGKVKHVKQSKNERLARSKSQDTGHEHVKNVSFLLDETYQKQRKFSQDSSLQRNRANAKRPEITRRSSAQAVLIRHRKQTRQLSSADWEEMTRDSAIRRLSDGANLNETKSGLFSSFKATQVKQLHGLKEDRSLLVEAHLQRKALSFSINLQSGAGRMPYADVRTVLLMFNPLLREKRISCNSFLYGEWGTEEVWDVERLRTESEFEDFPFCAGGRYRIKITVQKDNYSIYVDGRHLLDYCHRLSFDLISHIRLEGDSYYCGTECPLPLDLPYIHEVPAGLRSGHAILLDTYVWKSSQSFEIQISARQQEVYALFVTQTTFAGDITRVECNAFLNGDKREEVLIDGHLPLARNQQMVLKLVAEDTSFKVYVNDQHFADYEHCLPLEKLTQLSVSGDLSLYGVKIKRPPGSGLASLRKASRCCECMLL